jgi:hypothetical protein
MARNPANQQGEKMQETSNGFRVQIPPKRRKSAVVFILVVSVFVGAVGTYFIARADELTKLLFPLAICVLFIGIAVLTLIGELFGKEAIELDGFMLIVTEITFGFKFTRRFDVTLMKNLIMGAANYWQGDTYVMSNGRIHFEYNARMVSIGGTIDEGEAFKIIGRIRKQLTVEDHTVTQ